MPTEITHDADATRPVFQFGAGELGNTRTETPAGGNINPTVSGAIEEGNAETDGTFEDAEGDAEKADKAADALDGNEEDKAKGGNDIDTDLSADGKGGDGKDALGKTGDGSKDANRMNSGVPSNQSAQQPSMPQMSSPSSGGGGSPSSGGSGGGMPLSNMTQNDLANSPNRDALVNQLKESDSKSGGSLGNLSSDEEERRVQELAEKIVNAEPPIPYTWGGGHGGDPGPSGGIRDGGVADSFGDYAKTGVDCSGLARWMTYELYGVDINGTSQNQYASGQPVSASEARPGDIFFPDSAGRPPTHVQVYVGNNQVIEAQKSGTNMMFSPLSSGEFRRYVD